MRLLAAYVITKALGATVTLDSNDVRHAFAGGGTGRVAPRESAAPVRVSNSTGRPQPDNVSKVAACCRGAPETRDLVLKTAPGRKEHIP